MGFCVPRNDVQAPASTLDVEEEHEELFGVFSLDSGHDSMVSCDCGRSHRQEGSPLKPLNWSIDHGMVQNGKGVCYVLASNFIVAEVGNKSEHGVSLKSGTVSALQQAAKRLEATASAMLEKAAQIEKYGLDNLE